MYIILRQAAQYLPAQYFRPGMPLFNIYLHILTTLRIVASVYSTEKINRLALLCNSSVCQQQILLLAYQFAFVNVSEKICSKLQ